MSNSKKKIVRGKRYTAEEKNTIISFITEHNANKGRGGQSAAAAKFGISQITLASWLKKSGVVKSKGKSAKSAKPAARKSAAKSSKKSAAKSVKSTGGIQKKLSVLLALGQEIEKLERTLKTKRAQFDSLKAAL
jgi:transposase-like protein